MDALDTGWKPWTKAKVGLHSILKAGWPSDLGSSPKAAVSSSGRVRIPLLSLNSLPTDVRLFTRWWNCKGAYRNLVFGTVFTYPREATKSLSVSTLKVCLTLKATKKQRRQRPFFGEQPICSKSRKEINNMRWIRTWLECRLPDKTGELIFFQAQAGLGKPVHSSSQQTSVTPLKLVVGPAAKQKLVYG